MQLKAAKAPTKSTRRLVVKPMPAGALSPTGRHAGAAGFGAGGSIEALLPFLKLSCRNDFVLVVAWLLSPLRGTY